MGELPQHGIQLPPYLVGGMIPRRTHIQGKLGQGIKSLYVGGKKTRLRVADSYLFVHVFSFKAPYVR
jgi:hypothetical protein